MRQKSSNGTTSSKDRVNIHKSDQPVGGRRVNDVGFERKSSERFKDWYD